MGFQRKRGADARNPEGEMIQRIDAPVRSDIASLDSAEEEGR